MCWGKVLPVPTAAPCTLQPQTCTEKPTPDSTGDHSIVWQALSPKDVSESLVSLENPTCQVTNSDLDLAGRVLHRACMKDYYDVWERTTLSRMDNTASLWLQRKGSTTSTLPPGPPTMTAGHVPFFPWIHTLPRFCEWCGKRYL